MAIKADKETVRERRDICRACPNAIHGFKNVPLYCGKCGCLLVALTVMAGAACPAGKWSTSTGAKQ